MIFIIHAHIYLEWTRLLSAMELSFIYAEEIRHMCVGEPAAMTMVINEYYLNDFWFRTPAYVCLQTSLQKLRFNIFIVFAKRKNSHKLYNLYRWKYRLTEQVIVLRCPMQAARMIVEKTFARLMLSSSSSSNVPHKIHFFFSFYWQKMKKSIPQNILIAHLKNDHVEIVSFWEEKTIDK